MSSSPSTSTLIETDQQQQLPNFQGELKVDDKTAREFSHNISKVVNLSHLVPSMAGVCQKFQLEQAAAAVSFERLSPAEREKSREAHFIDGLKRGFDFCFVAAKNALNEALTRGVPPSPSPSSPSETNNKNEETSATSTTSDHQKDASSESSSSMKSPTSQSDDSSSNIQEGFSAMQSFNSCEDLNHQHSSPTNKKQNNSNSSNNNNNQVNEHIIQCVAELSYYAIEALQQIFLVSKNPKIQIYMRNYAIKSTSFSASTAKNINTTAAAASSPLENDTFNASTCSTATTASENNTNKQNYDQNNSNTNNNNKLMEYIRQAFATSREIELAWFAEGFRTMHMNLLCNVLFDCPAACRAVLDCEGLVMLMLFHGKHLDPENPGLNEWSAFAMRTVTKEVPEAGERISEMKKKAQQMSAEKRKEEEKSEEMMRDQMRNHQQEFM